MISATHIALQFGGRVLFKDVNFRIGTHDRIGLVGSNGAGKTTLLRMLVGEIAPDTGEIAKAKYVSVGYLPQETVAAGETSLYGEVEKVFGDVLETQARLADLHERMAETHGDSEEFREMLELYGELQHKIEASDAYRMRSLIEKVLTGLGFSEDDFERPSSEFSGGWQMRIALAKLLLLQPSLLLLDEPTNHLDLDSLQWLEEYLSAYEGAVMIVSHDRRFLDNMTARTFEVSLGNLTEYAGNFTFYTEAKRDRREQLLSAVRNQQQQIRQTEQFIERFRYKATKARQVQSRIKQLEKLDLIELEDEEAEVHFAFPPGPASGRSVMELRGIRKRYGAQTVFERLDFDIERGDHLAFVGVNGAGKSTLSRIIAGIEPFENGVRKTGHNVVISYFAQHQAEALDPSLDVLESVESVAVGDIRKRLRNLLGSFLFRGDDVFKKVRVLSGGEKSRLALAKMLLQPANLLILDEPTNHLDMRSKNVLQDALTEFAGSYVIVSHDRDFLAPLVNKVVEFRHGGLRVHPGTINEYLEKRAAEQREGVGNNGRSGETPKGGTRERKRTEAEERQRRYRRVKPVQEKIAAVEKLIDDLEREKKSIEGLMGDEEFYREGDRVREATARYKEVEAALTDGYFRWNELTKELERLMAEGNGKAGRI